MAKPFSQVIAISPVSSNVYKTAHPLEKEWSVGSVPNGGYTAALVASAVITHSVTSAKSSSSSPFASQPHLLHLSLQYLRRTLADYHATFTIRNVKLGRRQSVVHLTLTQPDAPDSGEKTLVEGYATLGNLETEEGVSLETARGFLTPKPADVDLGRLEREGEDEEWSVMKEKPFVGFRRSSQHQLLYRPKGTGERKRGSQLAREESQTALAKKAGQLDNTGNVQRASGAEETDGKNEWQGVIDEWVRFTPYSDLLLKTSTSDPTPSKWTNATIPYLIDNFPPPVEQILTHHNTETPKFWYPTLTLNLDVKRLLPADGVDWLFLRSRPKVIRNGRMDLDVTVLDEQGEIVATATHSTLVLDFSRNTGGRGKGRSGEQGGKL